MSSDIEQPPASTSSTSSGSSPLASQPELRRHLRASRRSNGFVVDSLDQLLPTARITTFLPVLAERFARSGSAPLGRVEGSLPSTMPGGVVPVRPQRRPFPDGRRLAASPRRATVSVVWSGGSEPTSEINPAAVAAMAEVGIDITGEFPKPWTDEVVRAADVVVTMGCGDACPLYPGKRYEDWVIDDPAEPGRRCVGSSVTTSVGYAVVELGWRRLGSSRSTTWSASVTAERPEVLFVCVHNAGRSQMAAALLATTPATRSWCGPPARPRGRGQPDRDRGDRRARHRPTCLGAHPKGLDEVAVQASDVVITMGCGDACQIYPGKRYENWVLDDPAGMDLGGVRAVVTTSVGTSSTS